MGHYDEALAAVEEEVDRRIREGNWSLEFRQELVSQYYVEALRAVSAYEKGVAYLLLDSAALQSGDYFEIARLYALSGKREPAFRYLSLAGEHGWYKVAQTRDNPDLLALHDDPRWTPLMHVYVANRESGRDARRVKALSKRVDLETPGWSLPDADGNLIALSDLRGKIVVLNFWATWCGPCKLSMPSLDEFVKRQADSDVVVFCVDVWEKGKAGPLRYMRDSDYAMTLLYGNDDFAKVYGVDAIPHLCVIDKNGRSRFVESGASDDLQENLTFWTEALLGES